MQIEMRNEKSNFCSNQPLLVQLSAIKALTKRAEVLCSNKPEHNKELDYITKTMQLNTNTSLKKNVNKHYNK